MQFDFQRAEHWEREKGFEISIDDDENGRSNETRTHASNQILEKQKQKNKNKNRVEKKISDQFTLISGVTAISKKLYFRVTSSNLIGFIDDLYA